MEVPHSCTNTINVFIHHLFLSMPNYDWHLSHRMLCYGAIKTLVRYIRIYWCIGCYGILMERHNQHTLSVPINKVTGMVLYAITLIYECHVTWVGGFHRKHPCWIIFHQMACTITAPDSGQFTSHITCFRGDTWCWKYRDFHKGLCIAIWSVFSCKATLRQMVIWDGYAEEQQPFMITTTGALTHWDRDKMTTIWWYFQIHFLMKNLIFR